MCTNRRRKRLVAHTESSCNEEEIPCDDPTSEVHCSKEKSTDYSASNAKQRKIVNEKSTWYQIHICECDEQCCYQNFVCHGVQKATHFGCLALKIACNPPIQLATIHGYWLGTMLAIILYDHDNSETWNWSIQKTPHGRVLPFTCSKGRLIHKVCVKETAVCHDVSEQPTPLLYNLCEKNTNESILT